MTQSGEPRNPSSEAGLPTEGIPGMLAAARKMAEIGEIPAKVTVERWRAALAKEARDAAQDFNAIAQNIVDVWCSLFPREVADTHRIDLQRRIADALFRVRNNLKISDIPAAARDAAKETK